MYFTFLITVINFTYLQNSYTSVVEGGEDSLVGPWLTALTSFPEGFINANSMRRRFYCFESAFLDDKNPNPKRL